MAQAFSENDLKDSGVEESQETGASCGTIILLHGFGQQGGSWNAVAALLRARGWEVVAPDLMALSGAASGKALDTVDSETPGALSGGAAACGRDPLGAVCSGVANLAADLFQRSGRRPALAGYSMGGRIALEAALRAARAGRPLAIASLVLESAGLGPADEESRKILRGRNAQWADRVRQKGVEAFMDWWASLPLFASQWALPDDVRARLRAGRLANTVDDLVFQFEGCGQHRQALKSESLDYLVAASESMPVAYLAGSLDKKYCAVAQEIAAACPDARVAVIDGAGHNIHLEAPVAFVDALVGALG